MKSFVVIAFYKFAAVSHCETMKKALLKVMQDNAIKGTIILAHEGVNGTFCGSSDGVNQLMDALKSYPGLQDIVFRKTFNDTNPFAKAKVKIRPEIVTLGEDNISPLEVTGVHVEPEDWNQLISDPDVVIIDTRNEYEVKLGTFQGAISPKTDNFRDFPEYVSKHLADKKDKKIAMFCTGGIRCEKSTSYLKQVGFNEVYQLNGGILNYLEVMPEEKSLWKGSCFVFDERVALDHQLNSLEKGSIDLEWKNNNKLNPISQK